MMVLDTDNAIVVKNVSMHFNMASERIENLKEYFIKLIKHQLFFKDFIALDNVSFEVKKGEVFGIIGTNGSGKSTLLKIVSGILEPTVGEVHTQGKISPLIELGAGFDGNLTARENIFLNGAILGYSEAFLEEKFQSIVDFAELWDFLDMPIKNYSSGMVARIAFSIATIVKPDILIADEILSVGDFLFQEKCEKRIQELMADGTTVLIVSHNIDQIRKLCNRVLWIEKSKPIMLGETEEVCNAYYSLRKDSQTETEHMKQIVVEDKCGVCGAVTVFRYEDGMTYHTESFCSNCGAELRVSDMAMCYLKNVLHKPQSSLEESAQELSNLHTLCFSQHRSLLSNYFEKFGYAKVIIGGLAQLCDQIEKGEAPFLEENSLDLVFAENMLDLTGDPVRVLRNLVKALKTGGTIICSVPIYEKNKTEINKKSKHQVYREGELIRTQWGADAAKILSGAGIEMKMFRMHQWYQPEEQKDPFVDFDVFVKSHPYYFYTFNSWVIVGKKTAM